jgi:hypothetical protein
MLSRLTTQPFSTLASRRDGGYCALVLRDLSKIPERILLTAWPRRLPTLDEHRSDLRRLSRAEVSSLVGLQDGELSAEARAG